MHQCCKPGVQDELEPLLFDIHGVTAMVAFDKSHSSGPCNAWVQTFQDRQAGRIVSEVSLPVEKLLGCMELLYEANENFG